MKFNISPDPSKRNFGLDIIRAVSIWLVVLQHTGTNLPDFSPMKLGSVGVEFFFVLSGFLIGGILLKEISKGNPLGTTLIRFWTRRWLRILPLYYLVLLIKFIFIDHSIGKNICYYIFFLQNNFYGPGFLPVSWSLVIEEWFYLIVPFVLYFIVRHIHKTNLRVASLILFMLLVNMMRMVYVMKGNVPYEGVNSNFPFRLDSLFIGVTLAFLKDELPAAFSALQKRVCFITGAICFALYLWYYHSLCVPVNVVNSTFFARTIGFFILPLSIGLMVPYISGFSSAGTKNIAARIISTIVTWTSILTYSIYLIHPFVIQYFHNKHYKQAVPLLFFLEVIFPVYLLAYLAYILFEHPILNLRNRISPEKGAK